MKAEETTATSSTPPFPPEGSTTEHTLRIEETTLSYQAKTAWLTLRRIHKPIAHVFHTAYVA
ncbi:MAG TPA: hypothetical protein DCY79_04060, partial [Planctomycetaceae bacterium]|nr:hypothetical protein [Planctomycetaceae bacterium]